MSDSNDEDSLEENSKAKYPHIKVPLVGHDGNAYAILGRVRRALLHSGVDQQEVQQFLNEATSGDYDNLLATCMRWVSC